MLHEFAKQSQPRRAGQVQEERRHVDVEVRIAFLHQSEIFHAHLHLVDDDFVLVVCQRRTLGIEEQQPQLRAELLDKSEHRHDVIDLLLPQIEHVEREKFLVVVREDIVVEGTEQRSHHLAEKLVLAAEVVVHVAHRHSRLGCHRANGGLPHAVPDKFPVCRVKDALPDVGLQCLHSQR